MPFMSTKRDAMPTALDKSYGTVQQSVKVSLEKQAATLAAKLGEDETLTGAFKNAILHANENKKSVNSIHFSLLNLMEADPDTLECEEMDSWPVPGSMKKDVGDNVAFDRYEYKDSNGNTKKDSFYANVARNHPIGQAILQEKMVIEKGYSGDLKNKFTGITEGDMKRAKRTVDDNFTVFQGKLRLAVAAYFHIKAMRKAFAKVVTVKYAMTGKSEDDMKVDMSSPNIICIRNKLKAEECRYFTIPNFLKLDIDKAIAAGGAYVDVITANKRQQDDENPDEDKHISIEKVGDFEDATIAFRAFINSKWKTTAGQKELANHYRGAGSDDRLITLFEMEEVLTKLTGLKDLRDRYEALQSSTEAPKKEAA